MKYNILIGGAAGQGMNTLSVLLEKILHRKGYYVFSNKDYMSRVRGGHNFNQIRFGDERITSHHSAVDLIIALDEQTVEIHKRKLTEEGAIFADKSLQLEQLASPNKELYQLGFKDVAKELKNIRVEGSVALGAILKYFGLDLTEVEDICKDSFKSEIADLNYSAIKKGMDLIETRIHIKDMPKNKQILINGNQAIALGALAAGLDFYAAYPMTPSTSIMTYLSEKQVEAGIVVEQAEDEIAAINMAIGGSYAGARSMTGTSGGGFSLMVEALGLSGIMEIPLVVVDVQRPGPATGLPTRTEQSDLSFILTASHGEIPRMVIAVRDPKDAFYQTARALNLADKYQMPIIILNDQYLADANQTVEEFDFDKITIERHIAGKEAIEEGEEYKRYKLTENGISPRIIPGKVEGQVVLVDSDEHNEYGNITESEEVRIQQMQKRMKRMDLLRTEIEEPEYIGDEAPEILLVAWGSIYGPIQEAINLLHEKGQKAGALIFGDLWPLPTERLEKYGAIAKKVVNVEQNFTGQLGKLIRQETGIKCEPSILKYDGRQLSGQEIADRVTKEIV